MRKAAVLRGLFRKMAGTTGLEPAASAVTGQRSNQLNYVPGSERNARWWAVQDSNLRPPACKAHPYRNSTTCANYRDLSPVAVTCDATKSYHSLNRDPSQAVGIAGRHKLGTVLGTYL